MRRQSRPLAVLTACLIAVSLAAPAFSLSAEVHENPDTLVYSSVKPVSTQVSTLVDHMASGLDLISSYIDARNYTAAKLTFKQFSSDSNDLKGLLKQLNVSDEDLPGLEDDLTYMQNDLEGFLEYAEQYNGSIAQYDASVAAGDSANASLYSSRLRTGYTGMARTYTRLYSNATSMLGRLADQGVNVERYTAAIDRLNQAVNAYVDANGQVLVTGQGPGLWLGSYTDEAPGSCTIRFIVQLNDANRTPVPGAAVDVYVNDSRIGSISTGPGGNGSLDYQCPAGAMGVLSAKAAYSPGNGTETEVYSNEVLITPGTALGMGIDRDDAGFGDIVRLSGDLKAPDGSPLDSREIYIIVNGRMAGSTSTLRDGSYTYAMKIEPDFPAGECAVYTAYQTDAGKVASGSRPLGVSSTGTILTIDTPGTTEDVYVNGTLAAANSIAVDMGGIGIYVDGELAGTAITNGTGSYSLHIGSLKYLGPGDHEVYSSYDPGAGKALLSSTSVNRTIVTPGEGSGSAISRLLTGYTAWILLGTIVLLALPGVALQLLMRKLARPAQASEEASAPAPPPVATAAAEARPAMPDLEAEMAPILADLDRKDTRKAQRGVYFLAIKVAVSGGATVSDAMTPREALETIASVLPQVRQPFSTIAGSYEKAAFAPGDFEQAEVLRSIECMKGAFTALNTGGAGPP